MTAAGPVLEVKDLRVAYRTQEGLVQAVRGIDVTVAEGEVLGIVGESGSGKSATMLAVMGLLGRSATVTGSARFRGQELLGAGAPAARRLRGGRMAMVFQDPLSALNPVHRIGAQVAEAVSAHHPTWTAKEAWAKAVGTLDVVGLPQAGARARQYPHELSGGMRQRALIAMAICNGPDLLIADEPTSALDVTVQAQVLDVLRELQEATGAAIVLISHDLGVVAGIADRVQVVYAGRTAELGPTDALFASSRHPYTRALLGSLPRLDDADGRARHPIAGAPPVMVHPPPGCAFHPRCALAVAVCVASVPALRPAGADGQRSACHRADELAAVSSAAGPVSPGPVPVLGPGRAGPGAASDAAVDEESPLGRRLTWWAPAALALGLVTPVLAVLLRDEAVLVRGAVVMGIGVPAVLCARQALRAVRRHPQGTVAGRSMAGIGNALAWACLVIWGLYCVMWLLATVLPEQTS
ncbi:MAG: ABC transporter ATP-binding protein [Acidimicrobiia bacterium]